MPAQNVYSAEDAVAAFNRRKTAPIPSDNTDLEQQHSSIAGIELKQIKV